MHPQHEGEGEGAVYWMPSLNLGYYVTLQHDDPECPYRCHYPGGSTPCDKQIADAYIAFAKTLKAWVALPIPDYKGRVEQVYGPFSEVDARLAAARLSTDPNECRVVPLECPAWLLDRMHPDENEGA